MRKIILAIYAIFVTLALALVTVNLSKTSEKLKTAKETATKYKKIDEDNSNSVKATVKEYMEKGLGTLPMCREIFDDEVVLYSASKYTFVPIIPGIEPNYIENDKLKYDEITEELTYKNGDVKSHKGIDVSKFQGDIDWEKVADSGVEFAIIRIGFRGYGTGELVIDEKANQNIEGAIKAGIKVGVYFYSQAITKEEAVEEAEFVIDAIKDYKIEYPIVFDTEENQDSTARTEELTGEEITDMAVAFCDTVKEAGYTPSIYANLRWFTLTLDMSKLEKYDKWYAYYDTTLYFPYKIDMWQYSEDGTVDGIDGYVDLDISFKDYSKE